MPGVTYLLDSDVASMSAEEAVADPDVREWAEIIRTLTGERLLIEEMTVPTRNRFWSRRPRTTRLYSLYSHVSGPEYQVMNFAGPDTSIHHRVDKWTIVNYMIGRAGGIDDVTRANARRAAEAEAARVAEIAERATALEAAKTAQTALVAQAREAYEEARRQSVTSSDLMIRACSLLIRLESELVTESPEKR